MVLVPFRGSSCNLRIRHRHDCWIRIYRLMFCGYFSIPLYHNGSHSTEVTSRTVKHLQLNVMVPPIPYTPMHTQNDFLLNTKWRARTAALTVHQGSTGTAPKSKQKDLLLSLLKLCHLQDNHPSSPCLWLIPNSISWSSSHSSIRHHVPRFRALTVSTSNPTNT